MPTPITAQERFWSYVDRQERQLHAAGLWRRGAFSPCWVWTGNTTADGYGRFWLDGRTQRSHIVAWTWAHGHGPNGAVLDHLCRTRECCRPSHLEAVTLVENTARGQSMTARHARQTTCKRGHELPAPTAITRYDRRGNPYVAQQRVCLECKRLRKAGQL